MEFRIGKMGVSRSFGFCLDYGTSMVVTGRYHNIIRYVIGSIQWIISQHIFFWKSGWETSGPSTRGSLKSPTNPLPRKK